MPQLPAQDVQQQATDLGSVSRSGERPGQRLIRVIQALLVLLDIGSAALAVWLGWCVRYEFRWLVPAPGFYEGWATYLVVAALWPLALAIGGHYALARKSLGSWMAQIFAAIASGSVAGVFLLFFVRPGGNPSRGVILVATILMVCLAATSRAIATHLLPQELTTRRLLLLGVVPSATAFYHSLAGRRSRATQVLGAVRWHEGEPSEFNGSRILGELAQAPQIVAERHVTDVVVCGLPPYDDELLRCIAACESHGAQIMHIGQAFELFTGKVGVLHVADSWIADVDSRYDRTYVDRVKRIIDVVVASILLALTSWIVLLAAIAIKLTSKGPVLYKQIRVGRFGREFVFPKLRTMVADAEEQTGPVWATRDDPRVTWVGRLLRKTRLDELPQLVNVIKGEMSLVGPRPERPYFVRQFMEQIPFYGKRLVVPPGITGWAQINWGYDSSIEDVIEKLRYDLYYVKRVCPRMDLRILARTIAVMLSTRGAR